MGDSLSRSSRRSGLLNPKRRTAMLMAYLIAGDVLTKEEVDATWKTFNEARGHDTQSGEDVD